MNKFRMEFTLWVTVLFALTGLVVSHPVEKCAGYCKDTGKSQYEVGSHYVYDYHAQTVSKIGGADSQQAKLNFSATVDIHVLTPCEYSLQVRDVRLNDSHRSDFSSVLEKNSLRFWNHNGVIKRLCPTNEEPEWVLNIKRGILSTMQNSMEDLQEPMFLYETDIVGTCQTYYDVEKVTWKEIIVRKTKDLQKCSNHVSSRSDKASPLKKSVSLLRGSYDCKQHFTDNGSLKAAICHETQLFQPFSSGESGAKTAVSAALTFKEKWGPDASTPNGKVGSIFTTLKYQSDSLSSTSVDDDSEENLTGINAILQNLYESSTNGLSSSYPLYFSQLISELQRLDNGHCKKVISSSLNTRYHKLIIEALSFVRTDESLAAVKELHSSGLISSDELSSVLSTIPFIKSPTLQTVTIFAEMIEGLNSLDDSKIMLTVSSVVHSYCQKTVACQKEESVKQIMNWIEETLGGSCSANSRKQQDDVIIALKAIGNAGFITNIDTLSLCFMSSDNPVKIRLAAIDALRKMDCDSVSASKVFSLYTQLKENTEVRIAAYLMSMRCPSDKIFFVVKNTLHAEKTNQVGSLVWTHLENSQNKFTSYQQLIHSIMSNSQLKNKFNTDARRFSRNYVGSSFFDAIDVGTGVESNVVFSPESFLPRSLNLNLTADMFGESVNLFDFGVRLEGFESIVESIFDKNGYFPDENIRSMLESLKSKSNSAEENEIERLSDTFVSSRTLPKSPQGSMYARIFGNELYLKQFDGLKELINLEEYELNVEDILRKALQSDVDVSRTAKFLDSSYEISTSVGLPLKLKIDGTAALQFQSSAKSSFKNMFKTDSTLSVKAFFNPSAVVTINGEMIIDAFVTKSGLTSSHQLHTNTYLDVELDFQRGKLIDVKINVPRQESDIFSVSSQLYTINDETTTEVEGITEDSEQWLYCTSDGFSKIVGFQMCSELRYANASRFEDAPHFPLTGPFRFSAGLKKTDTFSAYHFRYQNQRKESDTSNRNEAIIFFETPGSAIERQFEMSYDLHSRENSLSFAALAQYRNSSLSVSYSSARKSSQITYEVAASALNKTQFHALATLSTKADSAKRLAFNWDLKLLENMPISGEGNLNHLNGTKYNGHLTVNGLSKNPFKLTGGLMRSNSSNDLTFSLDSDLANIHLKGNLQNLSSRLASRIVLGYTLSGKKPEVVRVSYKWSDKAKSVSSKDKMQLSLELSEFPAYNTKITWSLIRSRNFFDMNTVFINGVSEWQSRQLYRNWQTARGHTDFIIQATLSNPSKNLDYHLELDYQMRAKQFRLKTLGQLNEKKKVLLLISYERKSKFDGNLDFTAQSPWSLVALSASLKSREPAVQLQIVGNCTFTDNKVHNLEIEGSVEPTGEEKAVLSYKLTVKLPEELSGGDPIRILCDVRKTEPLHFVRASGSFKKYYAYYYVYRLGQKHQNIHLIFDSPHYNIDITGKNEPNESNLVADLKLSKHIYFTYNGNHSSDVQEIESKLFWDYDENQNKNIGVYLYHSDAEKVGKLYLEDLFMGLKLRLATDSQENFVQYNFLFSSSWGESEEELSGEIKLDGHTSDRKSLQFNEALGKSTIRQEFMLSTSVATPVKNFELQWVDLSHVKEITEESFVANNPKFWTSTSSKVSLSWHEVSDPLLEGQDLDYFGAENFGPKYLTHPAPTYNSDLSPNTWIERKVGAKVETTVANDMAAGQFLYFNDYSDVSAFDISVNHTLGQNGFKTSLESSYNYAVPLLHVDLNVNETESRASIKFTSPVKVLNSFTSSVVASNSLNYFIFETKWDSEKNITFWYSLDFPNYVGAEFMSPFQNYKLLTFQFKSKGLSDIFTHGSKKEAEIIAQFNDQKAGASISGQQTDSGFDTSLTITCHPLMETIDIFVLHDYSDTKLTEKLSIKSGVAKQTVVEANIILDFQDYTHTMILTDLRTVSNVMLIEILNKLDPEGVNCSLSGKWNKEFVLLKLNGEYKNEIDEALVQFQLSASGSPFRKDYDITFQHSHNGQNYDSLLILPFGTKLEHSLKIEDSMNWQNSIVLKSSSKSSSIVNEQKYDSSKFKNLMIAEIYGQKSTFDISLDLNENEGFIEAGFMQLTTPWSEPIIAKYSYVNSFKTVVLDSGEKSLLFTEHSFSLQYQNNKKISVDANGHAANSSYFVYDVAVQSPHFNNSHFTVKCDLTQPLKVAHASFEHNGHAYEMHLDYLRQPLFMNSSLTFSQDSSQISVSQLNFNLASHNKKVELITITKNTKYNLLLESQVKENKCRVQLLLNSPFNNWKKLIVSLDYDNSKNVKMAVFNYETEADSLSLSSSYMQSWSSVKGSLALNTNFQNEMQTYSLTGECEYLSSDDLTASLAFFNNDEASKFSAKWRNLNDAKAVKLEFTSPYDGYKLINGSFLLSNNTSDYTVAFNANVNDFELHSGSRIDFLERNYNSFLIMSAQSSKFKGLSANFELSKKNSTQFNIDLTLDDQFVKIRGSHNESDCDSQLTIIMHSSVENYKHSLFTANLMRPHVNSTEHRIHAQFELANDTCMFDAGFRLRSEGEVSSGSFNLSFPESWNAVDTSGSYEISPFSEELFNAEIYLQVGSGVNQLSFTSKEDQASLRTSLHLPILKLNSMNLSMVRFSDDEGKNYLLNFTSTNELMAGTFFESSLKLSDSKVLFHCQSSIPEFRTIHVSSNYNILKDKSLKAVFNRNNNTMNASLKFDQNSEYDAVFTTVIRDEYLNDWNIDLMLNYTFEKYLQLLVEKENIVVAKLLLDPKFKISDKSFTSSIFLNDRLLNLTLSHSNNSSGIDALVRIYNETKLDLHGEFHSSKKEKNLRVHSKSVLLPYPHQTSVFELTATSEEHLTHFFCHRANQRSSESRSGFFTFDWRHSIFSIKNPSATDKPELLVEYDLRYTNKTVSFHFLDGPKSVAFDGNLLLSAVLSEFKLSHASSSLIRNNFHARYNGSKGVDLMLLGVYNSAEFFKFFVSVDSVAKVSADFNVPLVAAKNLPTSVKFSYDFTEYKKILAATANYRGSSHFINAIKDGKNMNGVVDVSISSSLLPLTKKLSLMLHYNLSDLSLSSANVSFVTDMLTANSSMKLNSFNSGLASFMLVSSNKNRVFTKGINLELNLSGDNKTIAITVSRPNQNLFDQFSALLYFKNFTADSKLIRKTNNSYDVMSLSYNFLNKRELFYSYRKNLTLVQELGFNLNNAKNSSLFLSNIWKITYFKLDYDLSKTDAMNFEMNYLSRKLNCQISSFLGFGHRTVNSSLAFFWNQTDEVETKTPTATNHPIYLKIANELCFLPAEKLVKAVISLNELDYFNLLLSQRTNRSTPLIGELDLLHVLLSKSDEPVSVRGELAFFERLWGTDMKMEANLSLSEVSQEKDTLMNIGHFSLTSQGEPKISAVTIFDRNSSSNFYSFGSNIHYKSEYDHEFSIKINSSSVDSSQEIDSSFSWNDEILFLNFTFDLNIDKSVINATVKSSHFQDMVVLLNYDIKSENKYARLMTKFGTSTYVAKGQSFSSPKNKTLQLKFKSPIQGFSLLQLSAELSSFSDDQFLIKEKISTSLVKESFETKLDATFEVDSNPESPKLSILVSGNNIPEWNGKSRNWLITLHGERDPEVNVAIKISKWKVGDELDAKKNIFIQLKGMPANMQLSVDFPDVSKSIKAGYMIASNKTQKSASFSFSRGKEKMFIMNGFLNLDKIGVTNFEVGGFCHPFGNFKYSGVYKNRGMQSIILTLQHNEHIDEIEGHFRCTVRSSYFDLEFDSSLNNEKHMHVKGTYDFNSEDANSASLYVYFSNFELKAKFGGKATAQIISADMLVQSTVKIIENINLKFELTSPNKKENTVTLSAHINDVDYKLNCSVQVDKFSVTSKLDIIFPTFILKDLNYKVSFLEKNFIMRMELSGEKLVSLSCNYELNNSVGLFNFTLDTNQRVLPLINGPFSCLLEVDLSQGKFLVDLTKSEYDKTTSDILVQGKSLLLIQGQVTTMSSELYIVLKYGNETNKLTLKQKKSEPYMKQTQGLFFFESELPSLSQNVTKCDFRLTRSSLSSEEFSWQLDAEFKSPLKFLSNLVNRLQLNVSPNLKQLNFLLNLANNAVTSQESIVEFNFILDNIDHLIELQMREEFPNSIVPVLSLNSSCRYSLWEELKIKSQVAIQNSLYHFDGDYKLTDEFHAKAVMVSPSQTSSLKFGGFWKQIQNELNSKLYINSFEVNYNSQSLNGSILKHLFITSPKHNFKFNGTFSGAGMPTPMLKLDYWLKKSAHKYQGSLDVKNNSLNSEFSLEESNQDWLLCMEKNASSHTACNSLKISKLRAGKISIFIDKTSSEYLVDMSISESEHFNTDVQKIKHFSRLLVNVTNSDSDFSFVSLISFKKIQNKYIEIVGLKNWNKIRLNFLDEITLDFLKDENSGFLNLQIFEVSRHLNWAYDWEDRLNMNVNLELSSGSQPEKDLSTSLVIKNSLLSSSVKLVFKKSYMDLSFDYNNQGPSYFVKAESVSLFWGQASLKSLVEFSDIDVSGELSLVRNYVQHFVSFRHKRAFPLNSECTIVSPLIQVEALKINLKSENMTILFNMSSDNLTVEPYLFVKAGFVQPEGLGFLYLKNHLFSPLKSLIIDGSFVKDGNSVKLLFFSANALIVRSEFEIVGSYMLNGNQILSSLSLQTPYERFNMAQFSISLPLTLSSNFSAYCIMKMDEILLYSGSLVFARTVNKNTIDYEGNANYHSNSHKFGVGFHVSREEDLIRNFEYFSNFKKNSLSIRYNNSMLNEVNQHFLSVLSNGQNILEAELETNFVKDAFLLDSEVSIIFDSLVKKYATKVEFLNRKEKRIALWLDCPQFSNKIGIDLGHRYESLFNNSLVIYINTPFIHMLPTISLDVSNLINVPQKALAMNYRAQYNNSILQVVASGSSNTPTYDYGLKASWDSSLISVQANKSISGVSLFVITPVKNFNSFFVNFSSRQRTLLISMNAIELLNMSYAINVPNFEPATWYNQPFLISITALNPVQPVHFRFAQNFLADSYESALIVRYHWNRLNGKLTGVGITYSKTPSSRNVDLEIFDKQLQLKKDVSYDLSDYSVKVIFDDQNELGFRALKGKPEDAPHSLCLLTLYLPSKILSFKSFKSLPSEDEAAHESALGASISLDDKEVAVKLTNIITEDFHASELSFSHFAYEHDIILRTHYSPIVKRLQVIYSENADDTFTLELQTIHFDEEGTTESSTNFIIVHHASKLMFSSKLHSLESNLKSEFGFLTTYYSPSFDSVELVQILQEYNKSSSEIDLTVKSNRNILKVGAGVSKNSFSVNLRTNHKEPFVFEMNAPNKRERELQIRYGESRASTLYFGMPSNKKIVAKASILLFESETTDGLFTLQLNSSRLLWGKLLVPSETMDVITGIFEEYSDLPVVAEQIYLGFYMLGQENFLSPLTMIPSAFADFLETVLLKSIEELRQVNESIEKVSQMGSKIVEANHFYSRDIYEGLKSCFAFLEEEFAGLFKLFAEVTHALKSAINEFILSVRQGFIMSYSKISSVIEDIKDVSVSLRLVSMNIVNDIGRVNFNVRSFLESLIISLRHQLVIFERTVIDQIQILEETLEQLLLRVENYAITRLIVLQTYYDHFDETAMQLEEKINRNLEALGADLSEIEELQYFVLFMENNYSRLSRNHLSDLMKELKYFIDMIIQMVVDDVKSNFGDYANSVQVSMQSSAEYVEKYVEYPVFKNSFSFINRVYQKLVWIRKYHSISLKMQENVRKLVQTINNYAKELEETLNPTLGSNQEDSEELNTVVHFNGNVIEFSKELPFDWNGFNEKPHFEQLQQPSNQDSVPDKLDDFNAYRHRLLSGLYYSLLNIATDDAPVSTLVPPFQAQGLLIGSQYFITFDGRMYNFSSTDCSYILAGDFEQKTVFVTVNYVIQDGVSTKKSVSIISQGHEIEINHLDQRVYIDGNVTELPIVSRSISVMHDETDRIIVSTAHGFTVDCNLYSDICSIQINGWTFGKTGGLLGTYDNEPANDFSLPNGTIVDEVADFAGSWALQKNRKCFAPQLTSISKSEQEPLFGETMQDCEFYFRSKISPFRSCFPKVNPEPFLELCKYGIKGTDSSFCSATAAYITSCNMKSILKLPAECVNDDSDSDSLGKGDKVADVAFVVEDSSCILGSELKNLSSKLAAALQTDNFDKVNFAVVAYGGSVITEPHVRTMNGEIWSHNTDFVNLTLPSTRYFFSVITQHSTNADATQNALKYSLKLPWHAQASKTVVLITCAALPENYLDVLPAFMENNIRLHVLSPSDIKVTNKNKWDVLNGIDADNAYTFSSATPKSTDSLMKQAQLGHIAPLLKNKGSLFNLNQITKLASTKKGQISADIWSKQVANAAKLNLSPEPLLNQWDHYEKEVNSLNDDGIKRNINSSSQEIITPSSEVTSSGLLAPSSRFDSASLSQSSEYDYYSE